MGSNSISLDVINSNRGLRPLEQQIDRIRDSGSLQDKVARIHTLQDATQAGNLAYLDYALNRQRWGYALGGGDRSAKLLFGLIGEDNVGYEYRRHGLY